MPTGSPSAGAGESAAGAVVDVGAVVGVALEVVVVLGEP